jgi:hypothetical protein
MGLIPGSIEKARKLGYGVLCLGAAFDFAAFFLTVYGLENLPHLLNEGNPLMAFMFDTFGYGLVFIFTVVLWFVLFTLVRCYGKWFGAKWQLLLIFSLAIPILFLTFMDFSNNVYFLLYVLKLLQH